MLDCNYVLGRHDAFLLLLAFVGAIFRFLLLPFSSFTMKLSEDSSVFRVQL